MPSTKFDPHDARFPAGTDDKGHALCRCCGKPVRSFDGHPIHTTCIPKHWGKHANGINCSRCVEFSYKAKRTIPNPRRRGASRRK